MSLTIQEPNNTSPISNALNDETYLLTNLGEKGSTLARYIEHKFQLIHAGLEMDNFRFDRGSCVKRTIRIGALSIAIICGYVAWYPLAVGVMNIEINSTTVKVILAGGSWISYGSLAAWGTLVLVDALFKERTQLEKDLRRNQTSPACNALYSSGVGILGIASCLPNAYYAYAFNKENIVWPIIYVAGSFGVSGYSIHDMVTDFYFPRLKCTRPCLPNSFFIKAQWNEVRYFLCAQLAYIKTKIPQLDMENIEELFNLPEVSTTVNSQTAVHRVTAIFERILSIHKEELEINKRVERFMSYRVINYPVKIMSAILPLPNIYIAAVSTIKLVNVITESTIVKVIAAGFALAPSYLSYSLSRQALFTGIRRLAERYFGSKTHSMAGVYHKKKTRVAISIVVTASLLSSALDYIVAKQAFNQDRALDWIAVSMSVLSNVALTLLPMIDLSHILIDQYMSKFGDISIKSKQDVIDIMNEVCLNIKECSQDELEEFVKSIMQIEDSKIAEELKTLFPWIDKLEQVSVIPVGNG